VHAFYFSFMGKERKRSGRRVRFLVGEKEDSIEGEKSFSSFMGKEGEKILFLTASKKRGGRG